MTLHNQINALDLAFVVDTTGSMGHLIQTAQRQMIRTLEEVSRDRDVSLRIGLVEYRDHPPQDKLLTRVYPFQSELDKAQKVINGLKVDGGGDAPEAVLDGVLDACRKLDWRPHARRLAVLIGDAPPHGCGMRGDGFAKGCPCGETIESVTAALEETRVTLYALGLQRGLEVSFSQLSTATGGEYFSASAGNANNGAIKRIKSILQSEFGDLAFDRQVLNEWLQSTLTLDDLATRLESSRPTVAASLSRLGARGLLN
jgi:Mg-chelatase subunit ChlD